jgi:hypothetical protein
MLKAINFVWTLIASLLYLALMTPSYFIGWAIGAVVTTCKDGYISGCKAHH